MFFYSSNQAEKGEIPTSGVMKMFDMMAEKTIDIIEKQTEVVNLEKVLSILMCFSYL
jgi:hypothetical protein